MLAPFFWENEMQIEHGMLIVQTIVHLGTNEMKRVTLARIPCHESRAAKYATEFRIGNPHIKKIDCTFRVEDYIVID